MTATTIVAIPARMQAARLPGKPLIPLAGVPMIVRVCQAAAQADVGTVWVATDHKHIFDTVSQAGFQAVMTDPNLPSGTDRLAAAARSCHWPTDALIINLQGDEPLMPAAVLRQLAVRAGDTPPDQVATLATPLKSAADWQDYNVVKVVTNDNGQALYFSRAGIPLNRDEPATPPPQARRHAGIYAYHCGLLLQLADLPTSALESLERLEQLRWLAAGLTVNVVDYPDHLPPGVDTQADVDRLQQLLQDV